MQNSLLCFQVMGRHCGYLALAASLAVDADFCFIPEWPPPVNWKEILCKKLKQMREDGLRVNIILVAEGELSDLTVRLTKTSCRFSLLVSDQFILLGI